MRQVIAESDYASVAIVGYVMRLQHELVAVDRPVFVGAPHIGDVATAGVSRRAVAVALDDKATGIVEIGIAARGGGAAICAVALDAPGEAQAR